MKNIQNISSTTPATTSSPKYSLNEDGFMMQLNEAILAGNRPAKEKSPDQKSAQNNIQVSFQQMNMMTPSKAYNQAVSLNAYKAQKISVKSKSSFDV